MWKILVQTFTDFQEDKCTRIAAALSYYTIFSLAPLLTLAMAIGGLVLEPEDVQGQIEQQVKSLVGDDGAKQVRTMIEAAEGGSGDEASEKRTGILATIISSGVLLVGLIGLIGQMQAAMNDVWEVKTRSRTKLMETVDRKSVTFVWNVGSDRILAIGIAIDEHRDFFGWRFD